LASQSISPALRRKFSPSDLVQETSLEVHRDFASFRGERPDEFLAWLRRILLNNAVTAGRRYEGTGKRDVAREIPLDSNECVAEELRHAALSPRSLLAVVEEREEVERALQKLPEDFRAVLVLRSRDHLSFAEIAAQINRSTEAARKLWSRGLEQLHRELVDAQRSAEQSERA
jgi:RNA polymerase sigma-70 factor, ECF subfamily